MKKAGLSATPSMNSNNRLDTDSSNSISALEFEYTSNESDFAMRKKLNEHTLTWFDIEKTRNPKPWERNRRKKARTEEKLHYNIEKVEGNMTGLCERDERKTGDRCTCCPSQGNKKCYTI